MSAVLRAVSDWREFSPLALDPVLRAAADSFVAFGYHGTTMREIARRADLSVPGLYHHHRSKQAMLVAVVGAAMEDLHGRAVAADAEGADDPVHRLELLVSCLVLYHCHRKGVGLIAVNEMFSLEPASRRRVSAKRTEVQRLVDAAVLDGAARGMFRTSYPLDASRAVVTMCVAVASWFRMELPLTPAEVADRYVDYALNMLDHR
jgi:AcrR family transcriptional regulator